MCADAQNLAFKEAQHLFFLKIFIKNIVNMSLLNIFSIKINNKLSNLEIDWKMKIVSAEVEEWNFCIKKTEFKLSLKN